MFFVRNTTKHFTVGWLFSKNPWQLEEYTKGFTLIPLEQIEVGYQLVKHQNGIRLINGLCSYPIWYWNRIELLTSCLKRCDVQKRQNFQFCTHKLFVCIRRRYIEHQQVVSRMSFEYFIFVERICKDHVLKYYLKNSFCRR